MSQQNEETIHWIASDGRGKVDNLLDLYRIYQDRQLSDLRLLYSYTNFYVAALLALLTAFAIGLVRSRGEPLAVLLILSPFMAILLIHQGKLTALRFYRRYLEGRVRLTKIEYLLGLEGKYKADVPPKPWLWPRDESFLPERSFQQALPYSSSGDFIRSRAVREGMGLLTQKTFDIFHCVAWLALVAVPVTVAITSTVGWPWIISVVLFLVTVAIGVYSWRWHNRTRDKILRGHSHRPPSTGGAEPGV